MVVHQAVGQAPPPFAHDHAAEHSEIGLPIQIIAIDALPVVAPRVHVMDGIFHFGALLPGHKAERGTDPLSRPHSRGLTPSQGAARFARMCRGRLDRRHQEGVGLK